MQFDLFIIMDRRYVDDFRSGFLYMNNVRYFHDNFRDPVIGDITEGEFIMRNKAALAGYDPEFLKHVPPTVLIEDENYASTHIFCMYSIQVDHNKRWALRPDRRLLHFCNSEAENAKMVAVHITDTKRFLRQVSSCLRRLVSSGECDYAEMGHIKYMQKFLLNGCRTHKDGYSKKGEYQYQQEWRIHISFTPKPCGPTKWYVGDLHKLTEVVDLSNLIEATGKLYQGYEILDSLIASSTHHQSFGDPQKIRSHKIPGRAMLFFTGGTFE